MIPVLGGNRGITREADMKARRLCGRASVLSGEVVEAKAGLES